MTRLQYLQCVSNGNTTALKLNRRNGLYSNDRLVAWGVLATGSVIVDSRGDVEPMADLCGSLWPVGFERGLRPAADLAIGAAHVASLWEEQLVLYNKWWRHVMDALSA